MSRQLRITDPAEPLPSDRVRDLALEHGMPPGQDEPSGPRRAVGFHEPPFEERLARIDGGAPLKPEYVGLVLDLPPEETPGHQQGTGRRRADRGVSSDELDDLKHRIQVLEAEVEKLKGSGRSPGEDDA